MIRIHTLGGLSVRGADGALLAGAAAQPRRLAVLALLARAGERGVTREKLLALLWPDADDERGPRTLTQALYALRRDLGAEDAIAGSKELRLDPALVTSDASEFAAAVSRGDDARAASLFSGPFLDGFHITGAGEFTRWVDTERAVLGHDHARVLESLARGAITRGNATEAVTWWRRLAALDPLNARVTVGLMESLVATGDRAGALTQARVYETLIEQELDLPPDREVALLAEQLRTRTDSALVMASVASPSRVSAPSTPSATMSSAPVATAATTAATTATTIPSVTTPVEAILPATIATDTASSALTPSTLAPVAVAPQSAPQSTTTRRWSRPMVAGAAVLAAVLVIATYIATRGANAFSAGGGPAIVAVGRIDSYGSDSTAHAIAGPVADLLATSLARAPGLRVVSRGRMLELLRVNGGLGDTSAGGFVSAARRAGATELIDGTLYARPDGHLRLDLRRTDLATGAIGDVRTIEGRDLFTVVDSGTAHLVSMLGIRGAIPAGSVADVTTRSVTAYRMYEQGIRAYFTNEQKQALTFFDAAVKEDSLFALATYYGALAAAVASPETFDTRIDRAKQLAVRAPDRDRLTILADWAYRVSSPSMRATADTLAMRYPSEVEGHLYTGIALVNSGDFLAAVAPLERVVAMDSLGASVSGTTCSVCSAMVWLVSTYQLADSLAAAERTARRWLRLQPGSPQAAGTLAEVFEEQGRPESADSLHRLTTGAAARDSDGLTFRIPLLIRVRDYAEADKLLAVETRRTGSSALSDAYWLQAISLREQGKLTAALDAARRIRPLMRNAPHVTALHTSAVLEAQIQLELGHAAVAAALFDSVARPIARPIVRPPERSFQARRNVWFMTLKGLALTANGDTGALPALADSVEQLGAQSGYGRDQRLHHVLRALLFGARGDDDNAIREMKASIFSVTGGYTRASFELARLYLRRQRPREAVAILQPALRAPLDGQNLYVSRTELHDLLARAWAAAGSRDSAQAHANIVQRAWAAADAPFRARVATLPAH